MFNKKKDRQDLSPEKKNKNLKVGIAFGGGGARGFAHLGVIKALEEYGVKFDYVAGTSAGSIIGAMYASGMKYAEMLKLAKQIDVSDIKTNIIPLMPSKTDGIQKILVNALGDVNIEDLQLPLAVIAVDYKSTKELIITKGNLAKAVAGSCAVPAVFAPVEFGEFNLGDGGMRNNIPTDVPKRFGCDYVVGVDVNKHRMFGTQSTKMVDVIGCAIRIMGEGNSLRGYLNCDVMIGPETKRFKATKTDGMLDMIEEGYKEAIDKMPQILELFGKKPVKAKFKEKYNTDEARVI